MEELGRALVPGAFLPTVLASAILTRRRGRRRELGLVKDMAGGTLTGAVGLAAGLRPPRRAPTAAW